MELDGRALVDRMHDLLAKNDVDGLISLYSEDAEIVRFDSSSTGHEEIRAFFEKRLLQHGRFVRESLDQFQQADDIVMWDATVDTDAGYLQTTDVVVLTDAGLIRRHIPGIRRYWAM